MAYITKEQLQEKRKLITQLCKAYGVTATVSGSNSSAITVTIRKGVIDFLANHVETVKRDSTNNKQHIEKAEWHATKGYFSVNPYYTDKQFSGVSLEFISELLRIIKAGHYDNSDVMSDYFDCAWYYYIMIGTWDNPYLLVD